MKPPASAFFVGSLTYATVFGLCDPNYWGSWALSLKEVLEVPFLLAVRYLRFREGNPVEGAAFFGAFALNMYLWAALVATPFGRKKKPDHSLVPTPGGAPSSGDAPQSGAAHL